MYERTYVLLARIILNYAGLTAAALVVRLFRNKTRENVRLLRKRHAYIIKSEPIWGQDKYLGGALGSDDCIYG